MMARGVTIGLACALVCAAGASLLIGDGFIGPASALILTEIRLPRTLLALLIGGALGLCGAVAQGALRNPLADPGLLGITGMAGLGAMIAFYWGFASRFAPNRNPAETAVNSSTSSVADTQSPKTTAL